MLYKTATIPGIPLMRICAHTHTHTMHTQTHTEAYTNTWQWTHSHWCLGSYACLCPEHKQVNQGEQRIESYCLKWRASLNQVLLSVRLGNNCLTQAWCWLIWFPLVPTPSHKTRHSCCKENYTQETEKKRETLRKRESDDDETELKMKTDTSLIILSTHDQCFQLHSLQLNFNQSAELASHSGITKRKLVL